MCDLESFSEIRSHILDSPMDSLAHVVYIGIPASVMDTLHLYIIFTKLTHNVIMCNIL